MRYLSLILFLSFAVSVYLSAQPQMIPAQKGGIKVFPVLHATMVLQWDNKTIYVDPYGGADKFSDFPAADLILITDIHGDHLNKETLAALDLKNTEVVAPSAVAEQLGDLPFKKVWTLGNGENASWQSISIEALPMYNLPETDDSRHPKGRGNGYVLTLGGKRLYISGDTEDIPEMRQLKNIDVAFICMNMPYTMDVDQAADAVLAFKPAIVYPFHYRGGGGKFSDVEKFKELVNQGNKNMEVRLIQWYPEN